MELIKKHVDTVVVLGAILSSVLWMNGKFNSVDHQFAEIEKQIALTRADFEKEISIIKTVMIMKNIMPSELANNKPEAKNE